MIHWLQVMWWVWKWNRLKLAHMRILVAVPLQPRQWGRDMLTREARRIEREMADLEERITGRAK